jgi:hypothetical protein
MVSPGSPLANLDGLKAGDEVKATLVVDKSTSDPTLDPAFLRRAVELAEKGVIVSLYLCGGGEFGLMTWFVVHCCCSKLD